MLGLTFIEYCSGQIVGSMGHCMGLPYLPYVLWLLYCKAVLLPFNTYAPFPPKTRLLTSIDAPKVFVITSVNQGHFAYSQNFRFNRVKLQMESTVQAEIFGYKQTTFEGTPFFPFQNIIVSFAQILCSRS